MEKGQQLRKIRLKCRFEGETRTVTVTPTTEFAELRKRLSNDYGFDVSMKYEDKDGDMIILASQNDLDDIFMFDEAETINVVISETLSLPNLHLKGNMSSSRLGSASANPVVSLYNTSSVLSSTLQSNPTNIGQSSQIWSRPSHNSEASSITPRNTDNNNNNTGPSNTLARSAQNIVNTSNTTAASIASRSLRLVNGARLERFPNIGDNNQQARQQEMFNIRWKKGEMLGQGAFGVVYLGLNIDTGELMAVKQMATEDVSRRELSSLENEIHLLRNLRHPNIVRYIGTELNAESMSIFLEYVPGGSLKALIDKFGHLEESVARSYTRQLLIGLEYLHRHGIAHRDIKGANCLVGNDGVIKLADFGNSKHWRPITTTDTNGNNNNNAVHASTTGDIKGTPSWMAPEVIRDEGGSISWRKADIWSLACTTLEMTTGKAPWKQFSNPVTILYHIACQDTLPEYPTPASFELITFLNTCLQRDPKLRPDITSLLLHPFVAHMMLPPGMNTNNSTNWNSANNNNTSNNGSISSTSAYNSSMYSNRPSTVSHAVVGEWDRSLPQSLFYSQNSNTNSRNTNNSSVTPTVNTRESPFPVQDTPIPHNSDFPVNNDTSILLRAEDPELALEVDHDTHLMPIDAAAGYADTTSNSVTPMLMLPNTAVHAESANDNFSSTPSPNPSTLSTPTTTTYTKSAYPSRLVALNHTATSSPSTARTHKRRVKNTTPASGGVSSPSSRVSSAVKHTTPATGDSTKRSAKKGITSPVHLPRRNFRDLDSPLTINNDALVDNSDPIDSMNAIGVMEAQLAQLLQQSTEQSSKFSDNASAQPDYTTTTPIKNAYSNDTVNEDDVATPPNHNLTSHRVVPKLDIHQSQDSNIPVSGEKAEVSPSGTKKNATKVKRHSRNRPAFESFDSADHQSAWAGEHKHKNIEDTMNTIYNNVSFDNSIAMDHTSRTIHFDSAIDANALETSRNNDTSLNMDSSVGHDNDSLTGVGDEDTLCSNEPMLGYSSTEEYSHSARNGFNRNYYHNNAPRHKAKSTADSLHTRVHQEDSVQDINQNMPTMSTITTTTNTRGVMKSSRTSGISSGSKSQSRLNASKSQSELAEELSIVAGHPYPASVKASTTSVIPATSLQTPATVNRRDYKEPSRGSVGVNDSIDHSSIIEGLSVFNSLPNSTNTLTPHINNITTTTASTMSTMRHSSSRKGLESAASRHGTRHSTAKTANRLQRSDSNADSLLVDPLDISCDSLDKLHITGTAAASKTESVSGKSAEREGTAKNLNTRQSKRVSTASSSISSSVQAVAPTVTNTITNYQEDPRFERIEQNADLDYPTVSRLFDAPPLSLHEHTAAITRLRAPTRTNLLYSSSLDGTVRVWNNQQSVTSSSLVLEATGFKCDNVYGERVERRIVLSATGANNANTGAFDSEAGNLGCSSARTATVRINNLWVDENGESIYAACSDAAVRVWNGTEGKPLRLLRGHEDQITVLEGMDSSGNSGTNNVGAGLGGGSLIATGSADRTVRLWDVRVKKAQLFAFRGHGDTVLALRWGEGGRSLVSSGKDKTVRIWDTRAGRLRVTLEKHFGSVSCLRIVNNSSSNNNNPYTDNLLNTGGINNNNSNTMSTTDGTCIVSAGRDSMMNVWSPSGDCIHSQTAHRGTVSFLSEINYITNSYSAAYQNQTSLTAMNHNAKATYYAPFSANPLMISLGTDSMIKLWDMRRFKCIHEINPTLSGVQTGLFTKAVWSELGFLVASNNGLVRLYEHNGSDGGSLSGKGYRSEFNTSIDRSESHSPGHIPYPPVPSTASNNNSQDWAHRDLAIHNTTGTTQVVNNTGNTSATGNASTLNAVTDLLCTENMCASGAKSGQILRWLKA